MVKLDESILEEYNYLVARVSHDYARKYKMVSVDDVKQELWLWFYEHPNKLKQWQELDQKETTKLVARSLRNAAHDYCQKEKAQSAGYNYEDNFYYQRELVEVLLPSVLSGDWTIAKGSDMNDGVKIPKAPSEGGNWMVYLIDIEKAYVKLQDHYQNVLSLRYVENLLGSDLGAALGCSPDAARKRVDKALRKLIQELGGFKPYQDRDHKEPQ